MQVVDKFTGKKWSVPAKVYARPLEIYTGGTFSMEQVVSELENLGYRPEYMARDAGTFHQTPGQLIVYTRGFQFWDGTERSTRIEINFQGNVIAQIADIEARKTIDLARFEPLMIGGIYPQHQEDRILVNLQQVPPLLIDTLLAVEDRNFARHHGVSLKGISRAVYVNLTKGSMVQGGSTLTQQLVKNFYLTSDRTLRRKATEAVMAILLEFHFSKQQILEAYLNEVYLGQQGRHSIHGFGMASQFYFGRPLQELKPNHIALLVGMVKGPSYFNPRRKPDRALARRDQVIDIMLSQNLIDVDEFERYIQRDLGVLKSPRYSASRYPAFMKLVKKRLALEYKDDNLRSEGLRIFTTMDPQAQAAAETAVKTIIPKLKQKHTNNEQLQAAMVILHPLSGEVLALVGDANPRYPGFNRALNAKRPIGSVVKPAVYLTALQEGYSLASIIDDLPVDISVGDKRWQPRNFDMKPHGQVWLEDALAHSYNLATARLGLEVGVRNVAQTIRDASGVDKVSQVPSILLGALEMSPYQVASMFQTFASGGFQTEPRVIREVLDAYGKPLNRYSLAVKQVFNGDDVFLLTKAMQAVVQRGTARGVNKYLSPELNLAGKTGTSDDLRDSWFVGFSGNYLASVWVGNDNNSPTGLTGSSGALQVWANTMDKLAQQPLVLLESDNIALEWVDTQTGLVTQEGCPQAQPFYMRLDRLPEERLDCYAQDSVPSWIDRMMNSF